MANQQSLRDRAAGNDVAQREPDKPADKLKSQIRQMETQFQLAMPKGMDAAQLVRDALTVLQANPKLAECDAKSVLGALMTCSQLGLRPGVLGQAWVIPFAGKGQLVIGYQGLIALAHRSRDIASISARIVHERDHFDYQFGLTETLNHKPYRGDGDRGAAIAYYCVVRTQGGGVLWDVLERADAEAHRDKFAMQKWNGKVSGPWVDHFDAMALKTIIIRVLKFAPRSTDLAVAMNVDESVRVDLTPTAEPNNVSYAPGEEVIDGELVDDDGVIAAAGQGEPA